MEPPLSKQERKELRGRMLEIRQELMRDSNIMANEALIGDSKADNGNLSTVPQHMADKGSDNFEQAFTISRLENATEIIGEIDEALDRIERGTYGICGECGEAIGLRRLRARPHADLCVTCQQKQEQERA
ncbi:MAG: TraR/DksA C4-type zinc finger protein [Planctomycetota bacterium]